MKIKKIQKVFEEGYNLINDIEKSKLNRPYLEFKNIGKYFKFKCLKITNNVNKKCIINEYVLYTTSKQPIYVFPFNPMIENKGMDENQILLFAMNTYFGVEDFLIGFRYLTLNDLDTKTWQNNECEEIRKDF